MKAVIESLLYVAGDEGLTIEEIAKVLEKDKNEVSLLINELSEDYLSENRGLKIEKYGNKVKFVTKKEHSEYLKKMFNEEINEKLSASALETLAIIAYNEPVTRSMVDEIRGVSSAHIIRKLVFRNLVKDVGKSELPGRPLLYAVTDQFLDHFGLTSVEDLPKLEVKEATLESQDLFTSKYKEI